MSIIPIISYEDGLEQLAKFAVNRELIPFFGAGFTAGCPSCEGVVPNASQAMSSMKQLILESCSLFSDKDLSSQNFFELSELFFEYVPGENRALYFEKYYTGVSLFPNQQAFLSSINWPYAYTLNVDDGIEQNSSFKAVLPYRKLRRPKTSKKLLYKLHGDASHESTYKENCENIVFSQSQYLQAITNERNSDIYKSLITDYSQHHILFIGCSLQSETDLIYIYGKSSEYEQDTYRIVLRTREPSIIEQQNLRKHGVNEIIIVNQYEQFYEDFIKKYNELEIDLQQSKYEHINPKILEIKDKQISLQLLSGQNIFSSDENRFLKSYLHICRDVVSQIVEELREVPFVLLKGRRFSGKTYVMCSLTERIKTKDILYFPSTMFADEETVEKLILECKNSLFLFDSNSITPDIYGLLIKYSSSFETSGNKVVIAINSNDNYMPSKVTCAVINLDNHFHAGAEINLSNKACDSFGLTRRKLGNTNIDFLYILKKEQKTSIPFTVDINMSFTAAEKRILLALCALDKLYYSDLVSLSFPQDQIEQLCKKVTPLIELVSTGPNEATRHSSKKLVHNSKLALVELLRSFTDAEIPDLIYYIVQKFRPDHIRRRLYIEIILFDTLSQLFSGRANTKELFAKIYIKLQPLLENDLHYWLQRAKSLYRTANGPDDLDEAYSYAKKAYLDAPQALSVKAALTTALISCALSEYQEPDQCLGFCEEAVVLAYEAVFSEYFQLNPNYLIAELPVGKNTRSERRINSACNTVIKTSSSFDLIEKSNEILSKFSELACQQKGKR